MFISMGSRNPPLGYTKGCATHGLTLASSGFTRRVLFEQDDKFTEIVGLEPSSGQTQGRQGINRQFLV